MTEECRKLCRKHTDLETDQIEFIVSYLGNLQDIADKEQSNVYIDCLTYNGHSAIIVGEARPQSIGSIYQKPLLGMAIKIDNEPAVERGFQLGVPTVGVVAIEMPIIDKVIQSVFPITYNEKVIAVLIYEKKLEHYLRRNSQNGMNKVIDYRSEWLLAHIREAIVIVDEKGDICYCNREAEQLFTSLGYVDSILGMSSENIIAFDGEETYRFKMSGHTLEVMQFALAQGEDKTCVIIKDLSEIFRLRKENQKFATEYRELIHSMKNTLFLLKNIYNRKESKATDEKVQQIYRDLSNRVMFLMATMELKLTSGMKETDIKIILEELSKRMINLETDVERKIHLLVAGDILFLDDDTTSAVVLVVYELLCNILKYAFNGRTEGYICINVKKEDFIARITVEDNGCGFMPSKEEKKSAGLELIRLIVRERLNGKLIINSSEYGTVVKFDIV